ncbi:hypothetical protein JHW43_009156 [Diplocarpon mali]|nr:hypothetical protein JHW43_009156 [Diplocarpon mali]
MNYCDCKVCPGKTCLGLPKDEYSYKHVKEITELLAASPAVVTLLVGPQKTPIACHRALLSFYSEFFNVMLFGNFSEAGKAEVDLPEEDDTLIQTFVAWLYTGNLEAVHGDPQAMSDKESNSPAMMQLWVLGDKLLSNRFMNDVMRLIYRNYAVHYVSPEAAEYVYMSTVPESKLKLFMRDLLLAEPPFSRKDFKTAEQAVEWKKEWIALFAKGGELVQDCMVTGFHDYELTWCVPYKQQDQCRYLVEETGMTPEEWIAKKVKL